LQLSLNQSVWMVDFAMANSDYVLIHQLDASIYQKSSKTIFFKETCSDNTRKMSLEDWQKDENSAIAKASADIANACAKQLMAKLGVKPYVAPEVAAPDAKAKPQETSTPAVSATATASPASAPVSNEPANIAAPVAVTTAPATTNSTMTVSDQPASPAKQ
jgi:hypothetical protein